jgi:tRNA (cytidine/uridine-2'-O-)-methyltransferase
LSDPRVGVVLPAPLEIVLVEPQIPPNTGNVARLCAALGLPLHLVGRLGFRITDRDLKRAGLDYWQWVDLRLHPDVEVFFRDRPSSRLHFFSVRGERLHTEEGYHRGDILVFGSETEGLPGWVFRDHPDRLRRIPIAHPRVRSLNLSGAVSVATYEALRQLDALPR